MKKIRNFFRLNPYGREIAAKILTSSFLVNFSPYKKIYLNFIKNKSALLAKNLPQEVAIETTNLCNARCIMCPRSKLEGRAMGIMDMDLFCKIVDDCKRMGIKNVGLSFFGEPLVDPKFLDRLEYAKNQGLAVNFFSNGALLNEKIAQKVVESKCDSVTFSIDGLSRDIYNSIRVGLDRDVVYGNVNKLLEIKSRYKSETPKVVITGIRMDRNRKEMKAFLNYWQKRPGVNNVIISNLRNWTGSFDENEVGKLGRFSRGKIWKPPCYQLWQGLSVCWNGDVLICCEDGFFGRVIVGNLKSQTIEEVWTGKLLSAIRKLHLEDQQDKIPICRNCPRVTVWW